MKDFTHYPDNSIVDFEQVKANRIQQKKQEIKADLLDLGERSK